MWGMCHHVFGTGLTKIRKVRKRERHKDTKAQTEEVSFSVIFFPVQ